VVTSVNLVAERSQNHLLVKEEQNKTTLDKYHNGVEIDKT
jgi:hypothetical protein